MESFLQELGGCGRFQLFLAIVLSMAEMSASFSLLLMVFGIYNPGWTCLDNVTLSDPNQSMMNSENHSIMSYFEGNKTNWLLISCPSYERCQNVLFNPDSSTVVSEWSLICDKAWIPSTIISIQMFGMIVGSCVTGFLGDKIGRKRTFCLVVLMSAIFNLIAFFSDSWHTFAITRFLIGSTAPCMMAFPFVLTSEFSFNKWTSIIASIPIWGIGAVLFGVCSMMTRDWRQIHLVTSVMSGIFLIPTLFVPESMRWLTVRGKRNAVIAAANKIALINGSPKPKQEVFNLLWKSNQQKTVAYSWRDMLGQKARKRTLIFTPLWNVIALVYYVTTFGMKSLTGNFYTNLMIGSCVDISVFFLAAFMPNLFGRKKSTFCLYVFTTACLISTVVIDRVMPAQQKGLPILILVMTVKGSMLTVWYILQVFTAESYPTVIRTTCLGYMDIMARIGAMAAPYLIPNDPDTYYISYSIMAVLTLICSFLVLLLAETKGSQLMDTWDEFKKSDETSVSFLKEDSSVNCKAYK